MKQELVLALLSCLFCSSAWSQQPSIWAPSKPMRIIAPFAAGASVDLVARAVASHLTADLGKPVIVENKPGANGVIAVPQAARAEPDGHTLLFVTTSIVAVNPALYKNLPYDVLRDFAPIGTICKTEMVFVANPAFPPKNVQELIALARAKPDEISYASSGVGVFSHLVAEMLKHRAAIKMVHVPYKGEAQGLQELVAGRVQVAVFTFGSSRPMIEAGLLKPLGVPSAHRLPELPNVGTVSEQGLADFEPSLWYGLVAPKGTPQSAILGINRSLQGLLAKPETKQLFTRQGLTAITSSPEEMSVRIVTDIRKYGEIVRIAGITVD